MSKKEKSVMKIWENRGAILEGLKNKLIKNETVEKVAADRLAICEGCPNFSHDDSDCLVSGTGPCCSLCGCSMSLKLRSLRSACDDGKWPAVLNDDEAFDLDLE